MAKKNFTGNPAMSFISQDTIARVDGAAEAPARRGKAPEGYRINPKYIELRTRRMQLLLPPSTHDRAKALADQLGVSLNELVNQALEEALYSEDTQQRIRSRIEEGASL